MVCNRQSLGLAFVVVLAISAVVASAAQAVPSYTAASYPTFATGANTKGSETFTTSGGTVTCDSHFQGTLSAASSTLTVTPSYSNCEAFGFLGADIDENGCTYLLHTSSKLSTGHYSSSLDIQCETGKKMVITASVCEVTIGPQTGLRSVTTMNSASSITVVPNITDITVNVVKDGFGCPFSGIGHTKAAYHGDVVMSSKNNILVSGE
jgi:hypothetical protein